MIIGKHLKKGDTIGFVSPASPTTQEQLIAAVKSVENMGFKVKVGQSCYEEHGYLSGKDNIRAKDINDFFADESIDGIFCLRGGYGSIRLLNLIDYDIIKDNPKVFLGYSDVTTLHIVLNQKCNLITFHGPMPSTEYIYDNFDEFSKKSLMENIGEDITEKDIQNPNNEPFKRLNGGKAKGRLIGGNLSLLVATLGSQYEIDTKDKILFIEDIDEEPYRIDRMLSSLSVSGKLDDCNGIILGDWNNCKATGKRKSLELQEVFEEILLKHNKPIIYNLKAGHCMPVITLPIGAMVEMDADNLTVKVLE